MSKDLSTINGFSSVLKNYEKSIAQLLQSKYGISVEEFYVTCVNAVKKNPDLLKCDPKSLFGAILLSAECGLRPNTPEGHAFILPYKREAKFQIGYKGLVEMMYRNPRVQSIYAEAVFERDEFDYGFGLTPYLNHKPFRGERNKETGEWITDRGALQCVYAVCKLKDADPIFTVVERSELDKLKDFSKAKDSQYSPYNNGADIHHMMEIKSAIKKLSKLIPKASVIEISKAIEYDSKFEGGASVRVSLPTSADELVMPEIIQHNPDSLSSSFDDVDFSEADSLRENVIENKEIEKIPVVENKTEKKQSKKMNNTFDDISDDEYNQNATLF